MVCGFCLGRGGKQALLFVSFLAPRLFGARGCAPPTANPLWGTRNHMKTNTFCYMLFKMFKIHWFLYGMRILLGAGQ